MRKITIKRTLHYLGKDLVIIVQNENGHIGTVVTATPYQKSGEFHVTFNTWNQLGHKDDVIAVQYAKAACLVKHCVVSCICGIHLDDITLEEMQSIQEWVQEDIQNMIHEFNL